MLINYESLPPNLRGGLQQYIEEGVPTGHFLRECLNNNFVEAVVLADAASLRYLKEIALFLFNDAPSSCWGSKEKVDEWITKFKDRLDRQA